MVSAHWLRLTDDEFFKVLQPAYFGGGAELGTEPGTELGKTGALVAGGTLAAGVFAPNGATITAFAEAGSLSALASRSAICHI